MTDADDCAALDAFLARELPLSQAMGARVRRADDERLHIEAPLAANRNPHGTAFGGSLATLALLAAWTLVHRRLQRAGQAVQLVVQHSDCDYLAPGRDALLAVATLDPEAWASFAAALAAKGRARIDIEASVESAGICAVRFRARFAARRYDAAPNPDPSR